jgi:hypothetical protein
VIAANRRQAETPLRAGRTYRDHPQADRTGAQPTIGALRLARHRLRHQHHRRKAIWAGKHSMMQEWYAACAEVRASSTDKFARPTAARSSSCADRSWAWIRCRSSSSTPMAPCSGHRRFGRAGGSRSIRSSAPRSLKQDSPRPEGSPSGKRTCNRSRHCEDGNAYFADLRSRSFGAGFSPSSPMGRRCP